MAAQPPPASAEHRYGGQAVLEGVMMRGAAVWAVAVRRPGGDIHVESHRIDSITQRFPVLRRPLLRGVIVLGQSIAIGTRALMVASDQATDDVALSSSQVAIAIAIAAVFFVGLFIVGPALVFAWVARRFGDGIWVSLLEGLSRIVLFVGYLWLIGRSKEIRRVFEYHGAEHKTIAAYEHDEPLDPAGADRFPKEHVRCGTNFLIIVMIITIFVFALFGTPGVLWRVGSRIVAIPIIAGVAYEALRLGARFPDSPVMRALMRPGIWLQRITTREPDRAQLEVAIASFREVLRREREGVGLPGGPSA